MPRMAWRPWMRTHPHPHPHSHPHAARREEVAAGRQATATRRRGCCRLRRRWHPPPQPPLPPQTLPPPSPWPQRSAPRCSKACGGGPAALPTLQWRRRAERWRTGLRSAEVCDRCVGAPGGPSGSPLLRRCVENIKVESRAVQPLLTPHSCSQLDARRPDGRRGAVRGLRDLLRRDGPRTAVGWSVTCKHNNCGGAL